MKICFVCRNYPPAEKVGGIEAFTQTLARALVQRGHSVSVVGYTKGIKVETEEDDQGVHVLRLPPVKRIPYLAALTTRLRLETVIRRVVQQRQIDLVECPDVQGSLLVGRLGAPLVVRMHGANFVHFASTGRKSPRLTPFFEKRMLRLADHLVAVSEYIRDATLDMAGFRGRKCEVIYNGVDTESFRPCPDRIRDKNRILFVGRLSETKGAPNLFRALPEVFQHVPGAYLRFIGKDPIDGSGHRASLQLVSQLPEKYRARIELVGETPHDQMPREYQEAAIAIFPSRAEAHPIAVLEAMACATPVIFMNHGPGPEMIRHNVEGLLCDTDSPKSIANAILALMLASQSAQRMGTHAAERIASTLSLKTTTERNEAFYRQCIEKQASDK